MNTPSRPGITRRHLLLSSTAAFFLGIASSGGATILKGVPWKAFDNSPPEVLGPSGWYVFTADEVRAVEALVERLIPADELSVSGKDAGCADFIDRQLAGSYGTSSRLYMQGPFVAGTTEQGDQSPFVPQQRYRIGLAALDAHCRSGFGKVFAELSDADKDKTIGGMEKGDIQFKDIDAKLFFATLLQNTMEGFFADPVYGGNRDMVSWKMLGFPGARYDYRDYVELHNQKIDLPPLSIAGRPEWKRKG